MADLCSMCGGPITQRFVPMKEWNSDGPLCGKCYSKKISEHYPGEHVRLGMSNND